MRKMNGFVEALIWMIACLPCAAIASTPESPAVEGDDPGAGGIPASAYRRIRNDPFFESAVSGLSAKYGACRVARRSQVDWSCEDGGGAGRAASSEGAWCVFAIQVTCHRQSGGYVIAFFGGKDIEAMDYGRYTEIERMNLMLPHAGGPQ